MDDYIVYTDGAYSSTRKQMGIGIAFLKDNVLILEYSKMFPNGTNNQAEIAAVIIALKMIKNPINSLTIYTDSEYVIGCASLGWKRKKNAELWKKFDKQLEYSKQLCSNIIFKHVKGHSGDRWNDYVDKLAVAASKRV